MLILSNEEIESFLSIKTCIDALESAYRSWDRGTAINRPRTDLVMPSSSEAGVYAFKSMEAGLYDPPIVAMRINSDIIRWNRQGGRVIKTKIPSAPGDKYVGLVMLFSTVTGEPLAMFPDASGELERRERELSQERRELHARIDNLREELRTASTGEANEPDA